MSIDPFIIKCYPLDLNRLSLPILNYVSHHRNETFVTIKSTMVGN